MIGRTLAHYEILAKIGEGGMGEVYRARDRKLDREVAIKVLPREMSGDPERIARFQREARTLASLQHSNVASVYGFEETPEARFLVMELVEGDDLTVRLDQGAIPAKEAISIARQLAEGLEAAHERNIVHRDLKPANIKLAHDGTAKILDFGLARAYVGDPEEPESMEHSPTITAAMTQAGTILGTAAYMSPEQAKGRAVDRRADIWAWGVILWEMLTGERLFTGDSVSDTLAGVLRQDIDVEQLPDGTPRSLQLLVSKCLQRDPGKRLQHIGDASIYFDHPEELPGREASGVTHGVWRWIALGLAVVTVVLAALLLRPDAPTPAEGTARVERWSFAATDEAAGNSLTAAISPDGLSVAYVDAAGLWVREFDELEPRSLHRSETCEKVTWSPDSRSIMFSDGNRLFRIARTGGQLNSVGVLPSGSLGDAATITWDARDRIVIGTGMSGLLHVPTPGADAEAFVPLTEGETDFHQVAALPDAKGWVFVVHDRSGDYGRMDLYTSDGERRTLVDLAPTDVGQICVDPAGYLLFRREGSNPGIWGMAFSFESLEVTGAPFLVAPGGKDVSVSSDGTLVYTTDDSNDEGELVWLDRRGNDIEVLTRVKSNRPFPDLGPGDQEFVMPVIAERGRDLWTFDSRSGLGRQVHQTTMNEEYAVFSVDGSMVYTYAVADEGYTIHRFPVRSPAQSESVVQGFLPHVRDDLGLLYYSRPRSDGFLFDICALSLDDLDAEPQVLVESSAINWAVSTSPDGKFMVYVSSESGEYEIYLTSLPEARSRWRVSLNGGHWPRWSHDGSEIFYSMDDGIYSAAFRDENGVRLGEPELLFEYPTTGWSGEWASGFDVDETGQRILVLRSPESDSVASARVVVVENWAAEFAEGVALGQ